MLEGSILAVRIYFDYEQHGLLSVSRVIGYMLVFTLCCLAIRHWRSSAGKSIFDH